MKRIFLALLVVVFMAWPASAKEVTLEFDWTNNTEPDMAMYLGFHRVEGQGYDYDIPVKAIPCTVQDGACVPDNPLDKQFTFVVPDGSLTVNHFILRAEDTEQDQSRDSNEVGATIDCRPLSAATMLQGVYNDVAKTIDFTWGHADESRVDRWDLFNSSISGGPYTKVGEFASMTGAWPVPGDGRYYFTVVGFVAGGSVVDPAGTMAEITYDAYAPDSNEADVLVRTHPAPSKNFKVKIWIR